jgi:hypothetical protein
MEVELSNRGDFTFKSAYSADDIDLELRQDGFPALPRGQLACAVALFISGFTLIILGFVSEVVDIDPTRGIAFWVLGSVTFIPGVYFSYKFFKAYRAKTAAERLRILREIPDF